MAIFDELRELRLHGLSSPAVEPESEEVVDVREPEAAVAEVTAAPVDNSPDVVTEAEASEAARVLGNSDEVASEAGRTLATYQHQEEAEHTTAAEPEKAAVPARASKPAAKKPAAKPRRTPKKRTK